ncbi:hypothetical protein FNF28_04471 [Cafeteria roenbergensis]|uniref:DUF389 domain-containing protein n=1 Tax=Cafeteria roenbergensis TaxID=33653 RepID=A0A5A8DCB0_CAFRO|nr:hypothetical protein FNF28_04471 [Cafeteria roenbergensis]
MAFQFVLWIPEVAMVPKGVLVDRPAEAPTPQGACADAKAAAMAAEREAVAAATAMPTTEEDDQMLMPPMHELFAGKATELVRVRLLALAKLVFSSDPSFAQLSPDRLVHDLHVLDASAWPALPAQEAAGPGPSPPPLPLGPQSAAPDSSSPLPRPTPRPHDPSASAADSAPAMPGHASTASKLVVGDGGAGLSPPSGMRADLRASSGSPPASASSPGMSDSKAAAGSCVGGAADATAVPSAAPGDAAKSDSARDASPAEQPSSEAAEQAEKRAKQEEQAAAAAGEGDREAVADDCVTAGVAAKADAADKEDAEKAQAAEAEAEADAEAKPATAAFSAVPSSSSGGGGGSGGGASPAGGSGGKTASEAKKEEETERAAEEEAERAAAAVGESLADRANSAGAGEGVAALAAMAPGDEAVAATGGSGGAGLPDPDGAGDDEDGADAPVPFAARDDVRMARPTAADVGTGRGAMVMFRTIPGEADHVLALLAEQLGIGRDDLPQCGTVSIMSVELTKPRSAMLAPLPDESSEEEEDEATPGPGGIGQGQSRKGGSVASRASGKMPPRAKVRARVLVDKILDQIAQGAALSFDYVAMVSVASVLAGVGLATNNAVVIVASMLVSPLMAPVLALTFGIFICDLRLARIGAVTELVGLVICVLFGFMTGLVIAPLAEHADITGGVWPTSEMTSRGTDLGLIVGVVVAIASGCGVALGIAGNNVSGLVGVAISASLLPPIVNAGMLWAYSLSLLWLDGPVATASRPTWRVLIDQGGLSLALALVNIGCILVSATGMFWIKEVAPIAGKSLLFSGTTAAVRRMFVSRIGQEGATPPGPAGASGPDTPQGGQIGAEGVAQADGAKAGGQAKPVPPPPRPRPIGAQRALRLIIDSGWNIDPAQAGKRAKGKRLAGTTATAGMSEEPSGGAAMGGSRTANNSVRLPSGGGGGSGGADTGRRGAAARSMRDMGGSAHHTVGYGPSALRRRNASDAVAPSSDPRGMPPAWRDHHHHHHHSHRRRRKVEVRDDNFGIKAKRRVGAGSADGHGRRKSRRGLGAAKAGNDLSDDEEDDEFDSFTVTRQLDMSDFGGRSMLYRPSTLRGQVDASLAAEAAGGKGADRMALAEIMSRLARTRAEAAAEDDDDSESSSDEAPAAAPAPTRPAPRGVSDGYQPRTHAHRARHHDHSAGAGASLDAASGSAYGHQRTLGATQALSQRRMGAAPKRTSLQQMGWQ